MNLIKHPATVLIAYILLIALEIWTLNKYVMLFGPILLFIYIIYAYWKHITSADLNVLFKTRDTWKTIYTYTAWSVVIQGFSNKLSHMVLGIEPMDVTQYLLVLIPIVAMICSPVIEEVIFRKIIFGYFNVKFGFWFASIISSALFAVGHGDYSFWLGYFLIGMYWSWVYKKTGNIMIPIFLHILLNTVALIVMSIKGVAF